jgi:hypothetical protein
MMVLLVLAGSAILFASQANGQTLQIAPEWKAHLKTMPVIENCVYERKTILPIAETSLFQFRYQENAFLFRQIRNLNDVSSNHIPIISFYAGRFESNCWSIQWTSDNRGKLMLFPNADNIWKTLPENGNETAVYASASMLSSLLYYGIGPLDPATIEWPEEAKFTSQNTTGHKIVGEVTEVSQGRPMMLEWHYAPAPEKKFSYIVEYRYNVNLGLPYFPSEIRILTGNRELICIYKILILKTSAAPLAKDYFDPMRYFGGSSSPILTFSNNASYYMSDGHLEKVRPLMIVNPLKKNMAIKMHHARPTKLFIWGFVVLSAISLFFIWQRAKQRSGN